MRILIFLKTFKGGTGTFVKYLHNITNVDSELEIKVVSLQKELDTVPFSVSYFSKEDVYPERYTYSPRALFTFYNEIRWFGTIVTQFSPHIVITIDGHCLMTAHIVRLFFKKKFKIIATIHNNLQKVIEYKIPIIFRLITTYILGMMLKNTEVVVVVSALLAKNIKQVFSLNKIPSVIYNGIEQNHKTIRKIKSNNCNLLTVARLSPQKDIFTVVDAFVNMNKSLPTSKLQIVGDGEQKTQLLQYIKEKNIKNINFIGWKKNVDHLMEDSDIFIHSSNWDGLPYVILEAMSKGVPIIATDTPFGPSELLDNGEYGILVPMGDGKEMSKAMYKICSNSIIFNDLSKKSVQRSHFFSNDRMISAYKKLIYELNKL